MISDYFVFALKSIRRRGLRSWLTMIGIFIGIAAVVSLISLGQGLEDSITGQFEEMGSNKLTLLGKAGSVISPIASSLSDKHLTEKDLKIIESVDGVDYIVSMLMSSTIVNYHDESKNLFVSGMPPKESNLAFGEMSSWKAEKGRLLDESDKYKIFIGHGIAYDTFSEDLEIRDKLEINNINFKIVGILKKVGGGDDYSIYLPLDTLRDLVDEPELVSMATIVVADGFEPDFVAGDIREELYDYRNEDEDSATFSLSTSEDLLQIIGDILSIVQWILVGIAAISLIVGGVGIMNTMYTSVVERTKEIGIMKATGAKNSDILMLFLIESGMLGIFGGLIGIILGVGISKGVEFIAYQQLGIELLKVSIDPYLIGGALLFSFVVGSISGVFPARQAARLKPIDALRYE
jgi:putative ABC transport system permease protein